VNSQVLKRVFYALLAVALVTFAVFGTGKRQPHEGDQCGHAHHWRSVGGYQAGGAGDLSCEPDAP